MKRATITDDALRCALEAIARELVAVAGFDLDAPGLDALFDRAAIDRTFFSLGVASPAPPSGRGQRERVAVGWIWIPGRLDAQVGATRITAAIGCIAGVEEVTKPILDPQLGLVWQVDVIVRRTQ